jgi:hypothetical protein
MMSVQVDATPSCQHHDSTGVECDVLVTVTAADVDRYTVSTAPMLVQHLVFGCSWNFNRHGVKGVL